MIIFYGNEAFNGVMKRSRLNVCLINLYVAYNSEFYLYGTLYNSIERKQLYGGFRRVVLIKRVNRSFLPSNTRNQKAQDTLFIILFVGI